MTRYHPRFDSNVWAWPKSNVGHVLNKPPFLGELDTSDTARPWIVVYADKRGGVSALTYVIEARADPTLPSYDVFAYYNTQLIGEYDGSVPLSKLMLPIDDVDFSPREKSLQSLWTTLTEEVSPSYYSWAEIQQNFGPFVGQGEEFIIYRALQFIPHSINKAYIKYI